MPLPTEQQIIEAIATLTDPARTQIPEVFSDPAYRTKVINALRVMLDQGRAARVLVENEVPPRTTAIAPTNLLVAPAPGLYRLTIAAAVVTQQAATTITPRLSWHDGVRQYTNVPLGTLNLANTNAFQFVGCARIGQGDLVADTVLAGGGTGSYAISFTVESM